MKQSKRQAKEYMGFEITDFEDGGLHAVVQFIVDGTEYQRTWCVVGGAKFVPSGYWIANRSRVTRKAVGIWLDKLATDERVKLNRTTLGEISHFLHSDVEVQIN